ncbi:MAG TPA: stage 0 sporulation protein [Candidatus Atribacteria bacterium]|nr:stage 0 sporulation protein [Candidatus Atribacteria bacterium]
MAKIIGVRFRPEDNLVYFDPQNIDFVIGDLCVADSQYGEEIGRIVTNIKEINAVIDERFPKIKRKATPDDIKKMKKLEKKEEEALVIAKEKAKIRELPMRLIKVRYMLDKSRIVFYFVAENRIDFRELVRDLAAIFKTRIEMRQVGIRDAAKILGGIGMCGREVCCRTFLFEFEPISLRTTKEQNLSLNSEKITGICGRLKCCLSYEYPYYKELLELIPPIGTKIKVNDELEGKISGVNIFNKTVFVDLLEGSRIEIPIEELKINNV